MNQPGVFGAVLAILALLNDDGRGISENLLGCHTNVDAFRKAVLLRITVGQCNQNVGMRLVVEFGCSRVHYCDIFVDHGLRWLEDAMPVAYVCADLVSRPGLQYVAKNKDIGAQRAGIVVKITL